jgi:hypothetical protein
MYACGRYGCTCRNQLQLTESSADLTDCDNAQQLPGLYRVKSLDFEIDQLGLIFRRG